MDEARHVGPQPTERAWGAAGAGLGGERGPGGASEEPAQRHHEAWRPPGRAHSEFVRPEGGGDLQLGRGVRQGQTAPRKWRLKEPGRQLACGMALTPPSPRGQITVLSS